MKSFLLLLCFASAGCAMGEGSKWISADNKMVHVENIPYQVQYVRDASGFDMRGVRTDIAFMPDEFSERRRNTQAALMVAQSMCPTPKVASEMKAGDTYATRVSCGSS